MARLWGPAALRSLLDARGHGAKACDVKEMFNKDVGTSACLFVLTERWTLGVPCCF